MHVGALHDNQAQGGAARVITPGVSPYTFKAEQAGRLVVTGGTVSLISYGRLGAFTLIGLTAGLIPLSAGDSVMVTYVVAPTVTFIPA